MVPAIVIFCTRTEASMLITAGQAVKKFKEDFPMKRIVSILAVLVLLLCSTAALAAAPSLSADLPKKVDYGTEEPVFSVKYNGSTYRWMTVWMDESGNFQYDNSGVYDEDSIIALQYLSSEIAPTQWMETHLGQKMDWVLYLIGKDFEKIAFNHTIKCLTDKDGNKYLLAEKGGKLSDIIKVVDGPDGPIPVFRRKWQLNNIRSVGPRFCDITPELTDKWFRFTPVDLSQDGLQMFDMISGDHYLVGTVAVLVKGDKVKVSYKYSIPNVTEKDEYTYFTFFPDYDSVTTVEPEKIENRFEYDVEYSIANDLGGDTDVLLYMCNKAMHTDEYTHAFMAYRTEWIELIDSMLKHIGKTLAE